MDIKDVKNILSTWLNCVTCEECPADRCHDCPYYVPTDSMLEAVESVIGDGND